MPSFACLALIAGAGLYYIADPISRGGLAASQFWKSNKFQQLVVYSGMIFVCASIREQLPYLAWDPKLSTFGGTFGCFIYPVIIYTLVLQAAVMASKALAKTIREQAAAEQQRRTQLCIDGTFRVFMATFAFSVIMMFAIPGGLGDWLANWLLVSARDANMLVWDGTATTEYFSFYAKAIGVLATGILLYQPAVCTSAFLTAYTKQMSIMPWSRCVDTFLSTLRAPYTELKLRDKNPLIQNTAKTFLWLIACYLVLFGLIGFMGGPLGQHICGWLDCSIASANTGMMHGASDHRPLRIFCAAIFALYGTVPLAVTGSIFLPYLKPRRIVLSAEGVFFPDGPFFSLRFRPIRLWSDFQSVEAKFGKKSVLDNKTELIMRFHSGGSLTILARQLDKSSLDKFLGAIDEHAGNCTVSDSVVALRAELRAHITVYGKKSELGTITSENYQSTIFVPHDRGAWLPNGESRVVRLLASRPLSCVYLVRMNSGQLAIAKQFFLADTNEAQADLRKTFEREYELLKQIDHPQVSKVLDVFHRDESTYLLIEHASGIDLHKLVLDEGPQPESTVLRWAIEVCEIMIALHEQDPPIVHRDLTPDNLILADDGSVRVIDFGAAHQFMEGITGTIIGKQCYVSPEQLQGQAGPQSDIYSFGCTLHYWLTAQEPVALTPCEPKVKQYVSDQLNDLVLACTQFDLNDRPQTFAHVKKRLLEAQDSKNQEASEILAKMAAALRLLDGRPPLEQNNDAKPTCVLEQENAAAPAVVIEELDAAEPSCIIELKQRQAQRVEEWN